MNFDEIHKHCKCCICEGELPEGPILARLPVGITWDFPQWGNILTGEQKQGAAFICEDCSERYSYPDIKYAIEFTKDDQVIYHKLIWEGDNCQLENEQP